MGAKWISIGKGIQDWAFNTRGKTISGLQAGRDGHVLFLPVSVSKSSPSQLKKAKLAIRNQLLCRPQNSPTLVLEIP